MTPLILATALSLLAADAGPATDSGQTAATAPPAATSASQKSDADDPDKVICKREVVTGSRFSKRVCMTRGEWGEQARRTEDMARRLGENAGLNAAAATGGGLAGN